MKQLLSFISLIIFCPGIVRADGDTKIQPADNSCFILAGGDATYSCGCLFFKTPKVDQYVLSFPTKRHLLENAPQLLISSGKDNIQVSLESLLKFAVKNIALESVPIQFVKLAPDHSNQKLADILSKVAIEVELSTPPKFNIGTTLELHDAAFTGTENRLVSRASPIHVASGKSSFEETLAGVPRIEEYDTKLPKTFQFPKIPEQQCILFVPKIAKTSSGCAVYENTSKHKRFVGIAMSTPAFCDIYYELESFSDILQALFMTDQR